MRGCWYSGGDADRRSAYSFFRGSYEWQEFTLPATLEAFGGSLVTHDLHGFPLLDGATIRFEWASEHGDFIVWTDGGDVFQLRPRTGLAGNDAALSLRPLPQCVGRRSRTAPRGSAPIAQVVASVLHELETKQIAYIQALLIARSVRYGLERGARTETGAESLALDRLAAHSFEAAKREEERKLDEARRSLALIEEALSVVRHQEQRIERMVDRICMYRQDIRSKSAEAGRAAEIADATTDIVARAARVTGGMTSQQEIDTATTSVSAISAELESRIVGVKTLVSQIRADSEIDTELQAAQQTPFWPDST